jgi:hypothetical protein
VAVGSTPKDAVTFTATDKTTVQFRGSASTPLQTPNLATGGRGSLSLQGALSIAHPDGKTTSANTIALDNGVYKLELATAPDGGFTVNATLQGTVH